MTIWSERDRLWNTLTSNELPSGRNVGRNFNGLASLTSYCIGLNSLAITLVDDVSRVTIGRVSDINRYRLSFTGNRSLSKISLACRVTINCGWLEIIP